MKEFLNKYLDKLIGIIVIIFITFIINLIIDIIIDKTINIRKNKKIRTLLLFVKKIKRFVLYLLSFLTILSLFDIFSSFSVTLLSSLGIGSVVLGLAAQESLKNFFASITIVFGNPFEVGDFIELPEKDVSGTVEDITMRHTIIKTIFNRRVIVPNSLMNTLVVENYSYNNQELVKQVDYMIAYEADVDKAMQIIKEELKKVYQINLKGPNKLEEYPKVRISSWGDSGINLRAWIWGSDNTNVFENMYTLNYNIKKRFAENNIEIPYPHVKVVK